MNPGLGLLGVAAEGLIDSGCLKPVIAKSLLSCGNFRCAVYLDSKMVDGVSIASLEQNKLEGWILDDEVGVAGLGLVGLGGEELAVKLDGLIEVVDIESELKT